MKIVTSISTALRRFWTAAIVIALLATAILAFSGGSSRQIGNSYSFPAINKYLSIY
jgi:hypothetical protein